MKKLLFLLLLLPSILKAEYRINDYTHKLDYYKNNVSTATKAQSLIGYVMAKSYGVVGDGITDDTAALQNAINACGATKTLFLPDGTFKVTSTTGTYALTSSCSIRGTAPKNCIIYNAGTGSAMNLKGSGYYTTWKDFQVKGSTNSEDGIVTTSTGTMGWETAYGSFENVWSRNHGRNGLVHRMAWGTRYTDCKFEYNEGLGVSAVTEPGDAACSSALSFINCDSRWNGGTADETHTFDTGGVKFSGVVSAIWFRGVIESNNGWGVIVSSQALRYTEQIRIDGVHMEDNPRSDSATTTGGAIFAAGDWGNLSVENTWISYGAKAGSTGYGLYITAVSTIPVFYPTGERLFYDNNNWMYPSGAGTNIKEYFDYNYTRNKTKATSSLDMNNYPIYDASTISIATNSASGYLQIKDKYILVSATTSKVIQGIINQYGDGVTYEFLAGTISVNSQINVMKNNITLIGQGYGTVFLAEPWANWTTAGHMIYSSGTSGLTIGNMKLDGLAANTGQSKSPITLQRCSYVVIEGTWIDYSDLHGMYIEGSDYVFVTKNLLTNIDNSAIYVYGYDNIVGVYRGYQNKVYDNQIRVASIGIDFIYCRAGIVNGNYIWGTTAWGISCAQVNYGLSLLNNTIFGGAGGGIFFYGTTTNGFTCSANLVSCGNIGMLVQGDISAGSITNNSIIITGTNNGIEIGSYNNVSNLNIIGNSIINAGNTKASINAYDMSNSLVAFNNCSNTATGKSEQAFLLQKGTGNVIASNLAYLQDTADYQINAFCYQNQLLGNIAKDGVKIIDNGRDTCLQTLQDCKWGFGVSSPTATVDVAGRVKVDNVWHVVGGTHSVINTVPCALNTWSKITNASGNLFQGTEVDGFSMVSDSMVVTNAGDYWGSVMISYAANLGNDWSFRISDLDTGFTTLQAEGASTSGSTNVVTVTIPIYLKAAANNRFILEAMNTSTNDDLDIHSIKFIVTYLHD